MSSSSEPDSIDTSQIQTIQTPSIEEYFSEKMVPSSNSGAIAQTGTDLDLSLIALSPYEEWNPLHHPSFYGKAVGKEISEEKGQQFLEDVNEGYGIGAKTEENGEYLWIGPGMAALGFFSEALKENRDSKSLSKLSVDFQSPFFLHQDQMLSDELRIKEKEQEYVIQGINPERGQEDWYQVMDIDVEFDESGVSLDQAVEAMNREVARRQRNGDILSESGIKVNEKYGEDVSKLTDTPIGSLKRYRTTLDEFNDPVGYEELFVPLDGYKELENIS